MFRDDEVKYVLCQICKLLPHTSDYRIWSDGDEILCETEQLAEDIADFFDALYREPTVNTGYYDPEEDAREGKSFDTTGFYYVTVG